MAARIERSVLAMLLLMVWEGFFIIGEGIGLQGTLRLRFADTCWIGLAVLVGAWLAAMALLTPTMLR
jgi:hypothetical protein